ncbi:hypothetical protein AZI87_03830 [Bdellovibrio bacteriovorus]|uniref:Outer membrane protein n=1 Tax=Bdellovibrio bacteriovorus TaxID=959 RepID=A0A162GKN2_BDEBC|nr:hypothetical protein [Bdellovibrio bacteriovorus]KYG68390.1 hypothetical protein AZI87_03830 [Bdellovibrio bacteriovorus]
MMFLIPWLFATSALAITPEQVLKTAWNDKTYLSFEEVQATDSKNPLRSVDGFVSTEDDDGDTKSKIGLKFQFKSWPEWKTGRPKGTEQKLLRNTSLGWALKNRYNTLLLYELNRQKSEKLKEVIKLAERNVQAQTLSLRAGRVTSKSFVSARSELVKLKRTLALLQQEKQMLETKIQVWVPSWKEGDLDNLNLISIDHVEQSLKETVVKGDSLTKKIANEEIEQISQELTIVKGREKQWFKGLDVSQNRKNDDISYEVEVTVQLPFLFSDDLAKQKQNELILKRALKQRDIEETGNRLETLRVQVLNLIEIYKDTQKLSKIQASSLDPLANIERKIVEQQEELDLLNQQQEILSLYLEYLLESEVLNNSPEKNYLDKSLKALL